MTEALSIKRKKGAADEYSFEQLRRDGIGYAQQFSGRMWSDYNLHDPGVTILEQLCYALTDLIHRASLDVADYLADEDGSLNFERLALHRPEIIFPARPTTLVDYRRAIIDAVEELDNLWLTPLEQSQGLYHVAIKVAHGVTQAQHSSVVEKVRRYYNGIRSLCEDVAVITIVKEDDYELCADIEVESGRQPAEILAEIYFECARFISGCGDIAEYDDDAEQLAAIQPSIQDEILVASIFSVINAIEGVDQIKSLYFEKEGRAYYDSIACSDPETALNLAIPTLGEQIGIRLWTSGRQLPVSINEMRARFDELNFSYHSSRKHQQSVARELPHGIARQLTDYFSIQNQFPVAYNIGIHGVPNSAPDEVKARAKQLKGYLLIFEQLMGNYLANLDFIKRLFSTDEESVTYSTLPLNSDLIPGFDQLFSGDAYHEISGIIAGFDNVADRKSRLLDYLLALYGESFPQHSLRHFNYYHHHYEVDEVIIANKSAYLKSVVELGRDRAAAGDYSASPADPNLLSGLQRRLNLLLGFKQSEGQALTLSLTLAILREGLTLTHHTLYERRKLGDEELILIEMAALDSQAQQSFESVTDLNGSETISLRSARDLIGHKVPLKNNPISDQLLRGGIYIDRYKIGSLTSGQNYQLLFHMHKDFYWNLGAFAERAAGINAAHSLRKFLIQLNEESEGMHVVEHLLLRPDSRGAISPVAKSIPEEFYSFRISVIFPAWSARCHDPQFRILAEETVILNTPAHIQPQFYWLEFPTMYEFEMLYEKWQTLKRELHSPAEEINAAALKLINFLTKNQKRNHGHG
jgi:hypothetical protein